VRAQVTVKSSSVEIDEEDSELYLKCAVEEGDAIAVKLCLEQGASVNCQFKDDLYTPLHTACSSGTASGSMEVLQLLLEKGADGNACNKWRETPLLIAANNGHRLAVEALLRHGANPSLCSEAGWSALTFAAHKVSLMSHDKNAIYLHADQTNFVNFYSRDMMTLFPCYLELERR
jgi:ankyrin repeat protein